MPPQGELHEDERMTHILVVEDEEQIATLIRDQLVAAGHSVSVAGDGPTALHILETRPAATAFLRPSKSGGPSLPAPTRYPISRAPLTFGASVV